MKKIVLLLFCGLLLLYIFRNFNQNKSDKSFIVIDNQKIFVEVADNDAKRTQGLSDRTAMDENSGMLFIFPRPDFYRFWMYHMNFPLDFVYIDKDKVTDLKENVPKPAAKEENPPIFVPQKAADKILEINAGKIKEWKLTIGDTVRFHL